MVFHSSSLCVQRNHTLWFRSSDTVCYSHRLPLLPGAPSSLKHYHIFYWETVFSQIQGLDISLWESLFLRKNDFFILSDNNFNRWQRVEPGLLIFCETRRCALCMRGEGNTVHLFIMTQRKQDKDKTVGDTEVRVKCDKWQQVGDIFIFSYFKVLHGVFFWTNTIYIHPKFFSKTYVSLRPNKLNTFPSLKKNPFSSLPFSSALLRFFGALLPPTVHWQD